MKGQTKLLKTITFALVCAILINLPVVRATTAPVSTEKIDKELLEVMNSSKASDVIPVAVWFKEIDSQKIESDVKSAIKINKASLEESFSTSSNRKATSERYTSAQIDEYIVTERELYSKAQTESHNAFIKKYDWLQSNKRNSDEEKIKFVSKYAPMFIAELTSNEILSLTKDTSVEGVYYSPNEECEDLSTFSNSVTEADFVRDTIGYTGNGVKIGMIEGYLPDPDSYYLSEKGIEYYPYLDRFYSDHATLVASIMIGNSIRMESPEGGEWSFEGIAPDAQLYAAWNYNTVALYEKVEWLLSQGVNVINASCAFYKNPVVYDEMELWIDHIAINHSVHFVVGSGNNGGGNGNITSPALAYNAITVGAINTNNSADESDDTLWGESSYVENNGTNKPDLVAPGVDIRYGIISNSGTSFAAPQVTAIVAQLCERQPALKINQAAMKAILTASINHSVHNYTPADDEYDKYGAGVVNAREALIAINNSQYVSSSFPAYNPVGSTHSYTFNVYSLDTIRVSLSWLKYSSLPNDHVTPEEHANPDIIISGDLSDLCLKVYDPNGNQVAYSNSSGNNTEIVQFEPNIGGTYTIKVTNCNVSDKTAYYALAWAILDDGL